ncbi:TPA: hypothetical protein DCZ46_04095 [Candidatus Campbellbacteria bacterium]|uniref:Uncharacterized protein n=1 Tax=Candidatus Campbellbacteria bacterium RIFCSPLOWO2_02_FULL_35_11 TaxID=1797581 RepID=A0A1F5EQZ2_9BACT|nr:MAG: hypothetical protein UR58_C0001G0465 [Candidatus Campbellbacteria bacterium GW2011_OD1_34_28]KKP75017.1 MAG: hypothetical protein UR74_C0002G0283 [Candidatus Campbellbacteria bacterium GW2011_GWD2_35_24]KKP75903.1 MAG: hypothetical protein UR75_C0002G0284 [Candidatus Campbellbacteria bacterium GW2011_GWC2_35_28]KKP76849.1 MAG: hypothetical protein UR76_C0002G0050 [Candidatus Campbellbacteria bacterium GW2011_GWC1_35_31]KKP78775.1 MAG: hypothetical protein UR79_C0002G0050 [Candidatus Cam
MALIMIPIEVPDEDDCKHPNGEVCRLFHWGHEDEPFCRGWKGEFKIQNFKKHSMCRNSTIRARLG